MIDKICDILMDRVRTKMPEVDEERAEVIRYGFELLIGEVPKMIAIFLIAILLGKFKYFLISLAVICPYRIFSGGIHLKTHLGCFLSTLLMYLGTVFVAGWFVITTLHIKIIVVSIIYIYSLIMIIRYAPADTDTIPILRKKDRIAGKIKSIIWITIILIAAIFIIDSVISNIFILGILFQTLTIMKISYKIFRVKLGYLEYEKSL